MPFTAEKDAEFGDAQFDVSQIGKRLVRASLWSKKLEVMSVIKITQRNWTWPWISTKNDTDFQSLKNWLKNHKDSIHC